MKENKIFELLEGLIIDEEYFLVNVKVNSNEEIIRLLGSLLYKNEIVKNSFTQAVLDREVEYPTGLETKAGGVAIPHADAEHVNKSALGVAILSETVEFRAMAEPDKIIPVSVVLMLAISDPKKTVLVLRKVMSILESSETINALKEAETKKDIKDIIIGHIKSKNN